MLPVAQMTPPARATQKCAAKCRSHNLHNQTTNHTTNHTHTPRTQHCHRLESGKISSCINLQPIAPQPTWCQVSQCVASQKTGDAARTKKPVNQMPQHRQSWKNMPSPVLYFFVTTKFDPKKMHDTKLANKPTPSVPMDMMATAVRNTVWHQPKPSLGRIIATYFRTAVFETTGSFWARSWKRTRFNHHRVILIMTYATACHKTLRENQRRGRCRELDDELTKKRVCPCEPWPGERADRGLKKAVMTQHTTCQAPTNSRGVT